MTKFLTKRNTLIASVAGLVLVGGVTFKAFADDHEGFGGRSITLEAMLEKVGENFDETDADNDGVITAAEADAAKSSKMDEKSAKMTDRLTSMFESMDNDGDGIVSEGDRGYGRLSDMLNLEGELTLDQVQSAIAQKMADRMADHELESGDDAPSYPLSRADALAAAEAKFAEADLDGDGVLSGEEAPSRGHGGKGHGGRGNR